MRGAIFSAAVCLAWTSPARATTQIFTSFEDIVGLTLSGNAQQVETPDGWVLRLTPAKASQTGSFVRHGAGQRRPVLLFVCVQDLQPGRHGARFQTAAGAPMASRSPFSASAPAWAVAAVVSESNRSSPSVAIEFDTYRNVDYKDPSSNHIGIDINGVVTSIATVDVDHAVQRWQCLVRVDRLRREHAHRQRQPGRRPPGSPQLSYPVNVEATVGDAFAYVGFTAATGGGFQNHDILSWVYLDHFVAADAGVPTLDGGNLPDAGGDDAQPPEATRQTGPTTPRRRRHRRTGRSSRVERRRRPTATAASWRSEAAAAGATPAARARRCWRWAPRAPCCWRSAHAAGSPDGALAIAGRRSSDRWTAL